MYNVHVCIFFPFLCYFDNFWIDKDHSFSYLIIILSVYCWGKKTLTVYYSRWSRCLSLPVLVYVYLSIYQLLQSIFGLLSIMAISSGYCIGSCNWIIDSDHERVTYIAGSSTLTTHPRVCRNMREHPLSIIVDLYHIIICFALQCSLGFKNITQIWRTYCYMYQNIKRHKPVIVR